MKLSSKIILPLICVSISFLSLNWTMTDRKIMDQFQKTLPPLKESDEVTLINIDDNTIENLHSYPLPRDLYAELLTTLKELGADSVVFDIAFLEKSPEFTNEDYIKKQLPQIIARTMDQMEFTDESRNEAKELILESLKNSSKNPDDEFSKALKITKDSYLALVMEDTAETSDENKGTPISIADSTSDTLTKSYGSLTLPLEQFVQSSASQGFVNSYPDKDGYRRSMELFATHNGNYYGQLIVPPILQKLKNPSIKITDREIILKDAIISGVKHDIKIPRNEEGRIILKYPHKKYEEYNNLSAWNIFRIHMLEKNIVSYLKSMDDYGLLDLIPAYRKSPLEIYCQSEKSIETDFKAFIRLKKDFIEQTKRLTDESYKKKVMELAQDDQEALAFMEQTFKDLETLITEYENSRNDISKKIDKSMCIIGVCATGTTDTGLNLYEESYPNAGIHATLSNMIISQDFIDDCPWWISLLISMAASMTYIFAIKNKSTVKQLLSGLIMLALLTSVLWAFFLITKIYPGTAVPFTSLSLTFISSAAMGYITESKEKKFITGAFSQCLSKNVVSDIIANPSNLKLGGISREMTAIFTDIQGFSTFSEMLNPSQLVELLNFYLTKMSDIIMEERGTIDKYEGDAIIAFMGAPLEMPDHAQRACRSAIKMKRAEKLMNHQIQEISKHPRDEKMKPELYQAFRILTENKKSIYTRIGINSGDMVAGFMGSDKKKNYTMMGNNVNLASRLEGVNKQYQTGGILISEKTRKLIGSDFVVRTLDTVRVVGITKPIRLYELLDESANATPNLLRQTAKWEQAMKFFEDREYKKAQEMFLTLTRESPTDNVAKFYEKRSNLMMEKPFPQDWDGVFNLTEK